jgi:hypothetical protein
MSRTYNSCEFHSMNFVKRYSIAFKKEKEKKRYSICLHIYYVDPNRKEKEMMTGKPLVQ